MSLTDQPERFYTPYQRRQLVMKLSQQKGIDLVEAGNLFLEMEKADPKALRALVANFDISPDPQAEEEN